MSFGDWQRIFIGNLSLAVLLEIAFRTTVMYLFTIGLLRLMGSRGIGQLSTFDVAIIIALGSAVGDPMLYTNVPLLHGFTVITVIVFVQRGISLTLIHRSKVEDIVEGKPLTIVDHGRLEIDNMAKVALSHEDVFMRLRHAGITHLGQVNHAYLEHDGQFSLFSFNSARELPGLPIVPPHDIKEQDMLRTGDIPTQGMVFACLQCGETLYASHTTCLPLCPHCKNVHWVPAAQGEAHLEHAYERF